MIWRKSEGERGVGEARHRGEPLHDKQHQRLDLTLTEGVSFSQRQGIEGDTLVRGPAG